MSLLLVGVSHRTSDLDLLERMAVPVDERRKVLRELLELDHVLEATLLSTCNRVEAYVHLAKFHPGLDEVVGYLAARAGDRRDDFLDQYEVAYDVDVARHLFRVAGGIESMVVGERQIAVQVKDAMEEARDEGTARRMLQRLFRQAVRVGRRLRNETTVSEGASSMVDVALGALEADDAVPDRPDTLIVGAGKIGALAADRLGGRGHMQVWNRSADKAERLAGRHDALVADDLVAALAAVDLVVCTTGAAVPLVTPELVGPRPDRPLVLLDLAMPHNVDPACADLPGVRVIGLEQVREAADGRLRDDVMAAALDVLDGEVEGFAAWVSAIEVEPTIRALRRRAEQIRREEHERLASRLGDLDEHQRNAVEALTQGIVNTLLHVPTVRLKERADEGNAQVVVDGLRELFDLHDEAP